MDIFFDTTVLVAASSRSHPHHAHMATEAFKENILGKVVPLLESRVRDFYEVVEPA